MHDDLLHKEKSRHNFHFLFVNVGFLGKISNLEKDHKRGTTEEHAEIVRPITTGS